MFLSIIACPTHKPDERDIGDHILCKRLLEEAVVALPNLRYLALAQIPNNALLVRSWPREYGQRQWPNARWQWWRIIRDTKGIEVREIPTWEGDRVRNYMRDADMAHADHFDGKSPHTQSRTYSSRIRSLLADRFEALR